ncbi:phage tail tape measure protein [Capnocytophaga gingivalis]|uniref:Phage tail tape measure protein n=1 Tax=Capnocytophaga gingivalis TaxID=1017 RepID=A0ABU5YCF6_9FLAO|nr:phage tail tape measure protein [Capnocytophaga gingivalis]MEB3041645.1 phage tail tape measure protein [Capnocytophaga gingivalis]
MNNTFNYGINFNIAGDNQVSAVFVALFKNMDILQAEITQINQTLNTFSENTTKAIEGVSKTIEESTKLSNINFEAFLNLTDRAASAAANLYAPGIALEKNLSELSAITGVTGEGLKAIEMAARETAKTFGTSAVDNVEAYKMMLSQLSPDIAKNSEAMKLMGENVNILSKQMGGDTIAATDVLNTSLNQFGVSMEDPIKAAKVMTEMMNVMSAAAQNGSAELPQIKQALEQVGMVAKTTGLSFAETNAYIQLLDQAGKKGSEGGIALRNVLTTLSEGRFTSKLAADGLREAGISTDYLADSSVPLHERLKTLRKIQGDTALMTKVFGKENMAAAIALINTADEAEAMSKSIEGTNSAVEQAGVIMESTSEKNARLTAQVEDFKISIFNATGGAFGYAGALSDIVQQMTGLAPIGSVLINTFSFLTNAQKRVALWTNICSVATKGMAVAQGILNAIMNMNPIMLVVSAIGVLIGYVTVAISYFDSFGSTMLLLLGPIGMLISAFMMIKRHWDSIVEAFKSEGILAGFKRIGLVLLDVIMAPLQKILGWVAELTGWEWAANASGSVEEFRRNMDLVSDEEKANTQKDDKPQEVTVVENKDSFDLTKNKPTVPTVGGVAATKTMNSTGVGGDKSRSENKVRNLSIGKMMDNFNIYMNADKGLDKQQLLQAVREVLLTATADFAGGND